MAHTGTDARSLIHVGDNPRDDVEGARRIGLDCIWVNPDDAEFPDIYLPPTATIRHVRELPALIEKLEH
jgi:FMN hydrolase / 5-amino-6-(5-phospho-D-ribitylamino)uracil phosphatase